MAVKQYGIRWKVDDAQAMAAYRRSKAALGDLDKRALRTANSIERVFAHTARTAEHAATATAQGYRGAHAAADASANGQVAAVNRVATAHRKAAADRTRVYSQEEAAAKAHEREVARTNRRMVDEAARARKALTFAPAPGAGAGHVTVQANLAKLHASLAKDPRYHVGPGGTGAARPGAYAAAEVFLAKARAQGIAVHQPRVGVAGGEAFVDDGRHRLAALLAAGHATVPVSVPRGSAAEFAARFGAGGESARVKAAEKKEKLAAQDVETARKAAEKRAKAEESAALGPYGRLAVVRRKALTDEQLQLAARNKAYDAAHNKRINQILKEKYATADNFRESIAAAIGLEKATSVTGAALLGLGAGAAMVRAVAGAFKEAHENAAKLGDSTLDFMVRLRPLASVMGGKPDAGFARKVAGFGVATGMSKEDAANFLEGFAGRAQITRGKAISDDEYDKFVLQAGKMTTARGIPTDVAADLLASVLKIENFKAKGQGAREATARAGALFDILDAGSGKIGQLAPQAQQLMAALASENELEGVFRNAGEVGVMTSLMAEYKPDEAAVFGRSTIKALSQFGDKDRQAFYQRAGIKAGMPALDRIRNANRVFAEEVAKGRPLEDVLEGFGLAGDVREKTGLMTAYKARDTVLAPQLERMRGFEGAGAADRVQAHIDARFKDEDVKFTQAKAANDAAGLRKDLTAAALYRQRAEAALKRQHFDTDPAQLLSQKLVGAFSLFGTLGRDGRQAMIEGMALRMAQRDAGVKADVGMFQGLYGDTDTEINRLSAMAAARAKGAAAPGAMVPGMAGGGAAAVQAGPAAPADAEQIKLLKRLVESNEELLRREKQKDAARPQAAPAALPVAPARPIPGR